MNYYRFKVSISQAARRYVHLFLVFFSGEMPEYKTASPLKPLK